MTTCNIQVQLLLDAQDQGMMSHGCARSPGQTLTVKVASDLFEACCLCAELASVASAFLPGEAEGLGEAAPGLSGSELSSEEPVLR